MSELTKRTEYIKHNCIGHTGKAEGVKLSIINIKI
jgi:hypothetical protein